ncbi:MAG: hypothetical protein JJ934_09845 [Pseudomonadales bacterium]|nr:hypothetical protein [Pseudomonadales bacterium]
MKKVFGIGFPKTATTSFERALEVLGYKVAKGHFGNNYTYWLMAMYLNGELEEIFEFIKHWDAFADAPWGGSDLYKDLHEKYPDANFILTIRDPEKWYSSFVKNFTRHDPNEETAFETMYKIQRPGSPYWFKRLFGIEKLAGNKDKLISFYKKHNQEVLEYFEGKDAKFLVMDITKGEGWEKLCPFLGVRTPDEPFPQLNEAPPTPQSNANIRIAGGTDKHQYFMVTSHGWSASKWLAAALNKHPEVTCVHSVGSVLPDEKESEYEDELHADLADMGATLGRQNQSLKEHFDSIVEKQDRRIIGSVHRYRLRDLPRLLQGGETYPFQLANLIRHPVTLVNSGQGEFTTLAEMSDETRKEIQTFFENQRQYYLDLQRKYDLDLEDWSVLSFLAAAQHQFVLVHDQTCVKGVANVCMERVTTEPELFRSMIEALSKKTLVADDDYINGVFNMGNVNRHTNDRKITTPEERFELWNDWQREAYKHFMEQSGIDTVYSQVGYDFSFVK